MIMRGALLCAAIVSAGAASLRLGYGLGNGDLRFSISSKGETASRKYSVVVEPWMLMNASNMGLQVKTSVKTSTCSACLTQVLDMSWRKTGITTWAEVGGCQGQTFVSDNRCWFATPTAGTYEFNVNLTCGQCSSAAELTRMDIAITTNSPLVYGGFNYQDDRNTDEFEGRPGSWGPIVKIPTTKASDKIFILPDINAVGGGVVYYFKKKNLNQTNLSQTWDDALQANDPAVKACASGNNGKGCEKIGSYTSVKRNFLRAPKPSYSSGEFPEDSYATPTGTWELRALVVKKPTLKSGAKYRFAIGLNHPPASAAGLIPNFLVVTLVSLAAFLR